MYMILIVAVLSSSGDLSVYWQIVITFYLCFKNWWWWWWWL